MVSTQREHRDIFLESKGKPLWGKNTGKIMLAEMNKIQKSYYNHIKMTFVYGQRLGRNIATLNGLLFKVLKLGLS